MLKSVLSLRSVEGIYAPPRGHGASSRLLRPWWSSALIERNTSGDLPLTDRGRAVLRAMLPNL
jgi:hypothetical protein